MRITDIFNVFKKNKEGKSSVAEDSDQIEQILIPSPFGPMAILNFGIMTAICSMGMLLKSLGI